MKVWMMPDPQDADNLTASGITSVLRDYARHAANVGIEFVDGNSESIDLLAIHAGMSTFYTDLPFVAHCHGLYWTGNYKASAWEYRANRDVISTIRRSTITTVPSRWVAATLERDMHIAPVVLPHGIDPERWSPHPIDRKYALWNKNRSGDVCDPSPVRELANRFPAFHFISTFAPERTPPNVLVTGPLVHSEMANVIQSAHIYLATTKETFGIGLLEAKASGVPILAYREGGAADIVEHGVDGYLAKPGDLNDLAKGFEYCLKYHDDLSANSLHNIHKFTWQESIRQLSDVYKLAMGQYRAKEQGVSVVIPCFNYGHTLTRAVDSAMQQTLEPEQIIIVDDGSTDDSLMIAFDLRDKYPGKVTVISQGNSGVAIARNVGCKEIKTKYACCLDADDEILPDFLSFCVRALEKNPDLALAYTRLSAVDADGNSTTSDWPGHYNFDSFLKHQNQVPTCCVFRMDVFERAGGYRQRYAPTGAGSEDANLWLRMGALGYGGILASDEALFRYHLGGRVSSGQGYREVDWLSPYAWAEDRIHPFASVATSKGISHEVFQYDSPKVSVVIACGPNHLEQVVDAIDSVEGQSLREWELIVVFDGIGDGNEIDAIRLAYPFVNVIYGADEAQGAGWARNRGAIEAKAPYLIFLDADDWLDVHCLAKLYLEMQKGDAIIYSDYFGHATMDESEARKLDRGKRLVDYDLKTGMATIRHFSADYDWKLAQRQPVMQGNGSFYIWNIITSMMPTRWHFEMGGFDEEMESWEDWDYWIRHAQGGKCFVRLEEPLVHYRFYTGERREIGRQRYDDLLDYMQRKYDGVELMPCSGCRGRTAKLTNNSVSHSNGAAARMELASMPSADDMLLVELVDGNIAKHPISFRDADNTVVKYGYRSHGEQFLVRRDHIAKYPNKFRILDQKQQQEAVEEPEEELGAPTPLSVFTSSDTDKIVAEKERDVRLAPPPKTPGKKPVRR